VFLHVGTRRATISPVTFHPREAWVVAQVQSFVREARAKGLPVAMIHRDRDAKYTRRVDQAFRSLRVKPKPAAICSPNTNAFVERFIQTLGQECLDHFVVMGRRHFEYLCCEFLEYYHTEGCVRQVAHI
jgi:putative transposase